MNTYFGQDPRRNQTVKTRLALIGALAVAGAVVAANGQSPVGTAFTYQGVLRQDNVPLNGPDLADIEANLYDALTGGNQVGNAVIVYNVDFNQGQFTIALDFGTSPFAGEARWLELWVRMPPGSGQWVVLTPRQPLTVTPYGLYTLAAESADLLDGQHGSFYQDATNLNAGTLADARLSSNVTLLNNAQTFTGAKTFSAAPGFTAAGAPFTVTATGVVSNLNADLLDSQHGTFYQNATNLNAGTLADARLSSNVALLNNAQTFTGAKTFSAAPSFSAAGAPFSVGATGLVTNLNADLLDGQQGTFYQNATNLNAGTLTDARLSSNVALLNAVQTFTANKYFTGSIGVGTTTPTAPLDVASSSPAIPSLVTRGGADYATVAGQVMTFGHWDGATYAQRIRVDSSGTVSLAPDGGNVGIGTTSPAGALEVQGNNPWMILDTTGGETGLAWYQNGASKWGLGWNAGSGYLYFWGGGGAGTSLTINDATGLISALKGLNVSTGLSTSAFRLGTSTTSGYVLTADPNGVGTWQAAAPGGGIGGSGTANYIPKFTGPTAIGNSVIYESGGNIGIGTTTVSDKLTVSNGNIRLNNTTDSKNWVFGYDSSSDYFYIDEYGAARRVVIKNGGDVGIGTYSPQARLHVATTSTTGYAIKAEATGTTATGLFAMGGIDGTAADLRGRLRVFHRDTNDEVFRAGFSDAGGGAVVLWNADNEATVKIDADESSSGGRGADVSLYNSIGQRTINLDADYGDSNVGRVITDVLQITGGSDLSEQFDVAAADRTPEPGLVVVIDPDHPGGLQLATQAYDRKVAGVISGANGVRPGMLMGQHDTAADGQYPVALTGRVWCWCDATYGAIAPGDLLTTSATPGHAMRVGNDDAAPRGCVIGKAMTALENGMGLVLVLVQPQ